MATGWGGHGSLGQNAGAEEPRDRGQSDPSYTLLNSGEPEFWRELVLSLQTTGNQINQQYRTELFRDAYDEKARWATYSIQSTAEEKRAVSLRWDRHANSISMTYSPGEATETGHFSSDVSGMLCLKTGRDALLDALDLASYVLGFLTAVSAVPSLP